MWILVEKGGIISRTRGQPKRELELLYSVMEAEMKANSSSASFLPFDIPTVSLDN